MRRILLMTMVSTFSLLLSTLASAGQFKVIDRFGGQPDGSDPYGALIYNQGLLYGTTYSGGSSNQGTVFAIDPASGVETILYSFSGGNDGSHPFAGLILENGLLYGMTNQHQA